MVKVQGSDIGEAYGSYERCVSCTKSRDGFYCRVDLDVELVCIVEDKASLVRDGFGREKKAGMDQIDGKRAQAVSC